MGLPVPADIDHAADLQRLQPHRLGSSGDDSYRANDDALSKDTDFRLWTGGEAEITLSCFGAERLVPLVARLCRAEAGYTRRNDPVYRCTSAPIPLRHYWITCFSMLLCSDRITRTISEDGTAGRQDPEKAFGEGILF